MTRLAPAAPVLLLVAALCACRGVTPRQMASMPAQTYHIEYYMITPK